MEFEIICYKITSFLANRQDFALFSLCFLQCAVDICEGRWFLALFVLGSPCVELRWCEIEVLAKLLILWTALAIFLQDKLIDLQEIAYNGVSILVVSGESEVELKAEHHALGSFARYGVHVGLADEGESSILSAAHESRLCRLGDNHLQPSATLEQLRASRGESFKGESVVDVSCLCPLLVGGEESFLEIGRIAHYHVKALVVSAPAVGHDVALFYHYLRSKGRGCCVFGGLRGGIGIEFHAHDLQVWITLREHQGDESTSRADVQCSCSGGSRWYLAPGSEENAICAHFHGAPVVVDGELLELEHREAVSVEEDKGMKELT